MDAIFERHLETIGAAISDEILCIGASGLGLGLGRALRSKIAAASKINGIGRPEPKGGFEAVVVGSCSQATLQQIIVAERFMPVQRVSPERILTDSRRQAAETIGSTTHLSNSPILITTSGTPKEVAQVQARYGAQAAGQAIEQWLAALTFELVEAGVKRLIVAGGETAGAVVDRLKVPAFEIRREIAAGVPIMRSVAGSVELMVALKSGNFGSENFFQEALAALKNETGG